jgi:hypothetical protein
MFTYLGIESLSWSRILSPRILVPAFLAATAILLIAVPYHTGDLVTASSLGAGMAVALLVLLLAGVVLAFRHPQTSLIVLTVCLLGYFAPSFEVTRQSMARHLSLQRGELILYPWKVFEAELATLRPRRVVVTPRLHHKYQMAGSWITSTRIARMYFRRPRLQVSFRHEPPPNFQAAIATRKDLLGWREGRPELDHCASFDATGQVVLIKGHQGSRR